MLGFFRKVSVAFIKSIAAEAFWTHSAPVHKSSRQGPLAGIMHMSSRQGPLAGIFFSLFHRQSIITVQTRFFLSFCLYDY
jgi:hypothetical protein